MAKKAMWLAPFLLLLAGGGALLWAQRDADRAAPSSATPAAAKPTEGPAEARAPVAELAAAAAPERAPAGPDLPAADADFATLVVHVRWADDHAPAARVGVTASSTQGYLLHERAALTDADGTAVLTRVPPGETWLTTAFTTAQTLALAAGEVRTIDLDAQREGLVDGVVVDADRRPVAAARLWLSDSGIPFRGFEVGVSDANGRFRLPFAAGQYLGARKAGHAPSRLHLLQPVPARPIELQLTEAGGSVRGRVVGVDGVGLAGAIVQVGLSGGWVIPGSSAEDHQVQPTAPRLTTDARGEFACDGLATGSIEVKAWAAGHGAASLRVLVEAGRTTDAVVALPRAAVVVGTVRDADGAPVAGAFVATDGRHYRELGFPSVRSAANGSFQLEDLAPGEVRLTASTVDRGRAAATLTLVAGQRTTWDPFVTVGAGLDGQVVGPDGAPVANVRVGDIPPGGFDMRHVATTDAGGAFQLPDLDSQSVTLRVEAEGCELAERTDIRVSREPIVIELRADELPTASVRGRVLDEHGAPIPARLTIWRRNWRSCQGTIAGADGVFERGPIPAGDYLVTVEAPGCGSVPQGPLHLEPGERRTLPDIVLQRAGRIELELRGLGATTRVGTLQIVRDDGAFTHWVSADGASAHMDLPPGGYVALAGSGDTQKATAPFRVRSGETTTAVLVLLPAHRVHCDCRIGATVASDRVLLLVRDDGGGLVDAAELHMVNRRPDKPVAWDTLLVPGNYTIEARCTDGRTARGTARVGVEGEPPTVVLEFTVR